MRSPRGAAKSAKSTKLAKSAKEGSGNASLAFTDIDDPNELAKIFDEAQAEIITLIYRDVFTRFWPKYGPVLLDYLREESEVHSMFHPLHGKVGGGPCPPHLYILTTPTAVTTPTTGIYHKYHGNQTHHNPRPHLQTH